MTDRDPESTVPEFAFEIEHGHSDYTDAELLEQSQLNAQSLVLAVFEAVGDDQALLGQLVEGIAGAFAAGWETDRGWQPAELLDALLTNFRSFGATVESYEPDGDVPGAVLTGLPSSELAAQLGISPKRFRPMLAVSEKLVATMGCELVWSHDASAGRIRLQVRTTQ